jgi:hypothetical protein
MDIALTAQWAESPQLQSVVAGKTVMLPRPHMSRVLNHLRAGNEATTLSNRASGTEASVRHKYG